MKFVPVFFPRFSGKQNFPDIEQLHNDLFHSMQKVITNYSREHEKLSDLYKMLNCEMISAIETRKGSFQIQFKGVVELQDTIYYYGNYGYRSYFMTNKIGQINFKKELKKGTVVPITGIAEYTLTKNNWHYVRHSVKLESTIAPSF
ncbi:hypothetical protein BMS3Abin09_01129 [bacterium BMS3Abin09]|nr:hypothetical protein BMS3Abin09_01129 [bacterium BMS3Abin09]GBE40408.1 hypothetical protein BMS3Bbin09_00288 [bacterium BMS3Bbin09]HDH34534.1 hypothetical protein [Nitrospirota bacterium]HDN94467.1 hypothetical protein [Nitrospirota bacterium]HDO67139.1 hypothetical protein [Nitrospirota bacterium]